jgi:DNA polymerase delta subunit 1
MDFYVVSWECKDVASRCEIIAWAKNREGKDVCVRIPWTPFFYVHVPATKQQSSMAARTFAVDQIFGTIRGLKRDACKVVSKKPFVGFRNGTTEYFVQVVFETLQAWKRAKYSMSSQHTLYEAAMDPLIKFFHVTGLTAAGWISIAEGSSRSVDTFDENRVSREMISEIVVDSYTHVSRCDLLEKETPPLVICSWDIEAFSASGAFPDSSKPSDRVITIGAVYTRFGSTEPYRRSVHVLGTCNDIENVEVLRYESEVDLIQGFMMETVQQRTDLLLAWNSYGFDHSYIDGRSVTLIDFTTGESELNMTLWSKSKDPESGKLLEKKLASSAYGDNTYRYHYTPGMISVDALQIFRKETKHDSYTLDNISKHYLDVSKIDLKPWEMFEKFKETDPQGRTDIATYCVRDCELPIQLVDKMNMLNGLIEFSKVTSVPIEWLLLRGQQIRVYSLIAKAARDRDFVIPDMHGAENDGLGFTGAVVLDPLSGGYTQDIICAMDFASLYPSIMMAHRMCGSTLVTDPAYDHIDGIEYYEVEAAPGVLVRFAQTEDNVIPHLLYELKGLRKQAKRDMEAADNAFVRGVLNSRQLAYKLVMNSLYGALGANHGLLCGLKKISMSVTATGRWMIHETKRLVETLNPGSKVVYGDTDSVLCILDCGEHNRQNLKVHFQVAEDLAAQISSRFLPPHELEMEKAYFPYLLVTKKRYAGLMFEHPDKPGKIDIKGLQLVRRDSPKLVKRISHGMLEILLYQRSFEKALEYVQGEILRMLRGDVPFEEYVMSKSLRSNYKNTNLPHLIVSQKRQRRGGTPFRSGERVPFVYTQTSTDMDLGISQRAEDAEYAKDHDIPIDTLYYIKNQVLSPLVTLLQLQYTHAEAEILNHKDIADKMLALQRFTTSLVNTSKRVRTNTANKQREITSFFKRDP